MVYCERVKNLKIKDYSVNDRPREKLMNLGNRSLSNAELLAILIGSGSVRENVLTLSSRILKDIGGDLNELSRMTVNQLCKYPGIGKVKAVSIIAALELGRRRDDVFVQDRAMLKSSQDVFKLMRSTYRDLQHEEAWALFADSSLRLISKHMVGRGGVDFTPMDLKIVLKRALECSARSIFLTHNHPSGSLKPSQADIAMTEHFVYACKLLDIRLNDHVIFADKGYVSFRDSGIIQTFE